MVHGSGVRAIVGGDDDILGEDVVMGIYGDPRCGDHAYRSAHGGAHAGALHLPLYR